MSLPTISPIRIAAEAESMHSAGYFIDALGRLLLDVSAAAPDSVEQILNGYTMGGLAAGLRLIGGEMMCRGEDLNSLLAQLDSKVASK